MGAVPYFWVNPSFPTPNLAIITIRYRNPAENQSVRE